MDAPKTHEARCNIREVVPGYDAAGYASKYSLTVVSALRSIGATNMFEAGSETKVLMLRDPLLSESNLCYISFWTFHESRPAEDV